MGITKDGNAGLAKGVAILTDVVEFAGLSEEERIARGGEYDEKARMLELDAIDDALLLHWENAEEARKTHEELEEGRAKAHTEWGQSGLAMSGSRKMVLKGQTDRDMETEANQAFLDDQEEQAVLDEGLREANRYRINRGRRVGTTLSLGSTIYKNRS